MASSTQKENVTTAMDIKRKLAIGSLGILGLMGMGGAALAQSSSPSTTPPATTHTAPAAHNATAEAPEPAGPDTDNIQEGDQTGPDSPEAADANEQPGTENEQPGTENEQPGTENPADDVPGQVNQ